MTTARGELHCGVLFLLLGFVLAQLDLVFTQGIPRTFSSRPFQRGPLQVAKAVLGGEAVLPCDIRPPAPNDSYILVVWYKQDVEPIYSYDIRGNDLRIKHKEKGTEWMADYLNRRAHFLTTQQPAVLKIDKVDESDEGEYRCRVDFMKNPTRNSRIQLSVIIPPGKPSIVNEHNKVVDSKAGPYAEGGDMRLTCIVRGGRPQPMIRWWRGRMLLDARDTLSESDTERHSTLVVRNLTRSDLHAEFVCQASNNNISLPVQSSVAIEMHLRPLNVTIMTSEEAPLSADRKYEITCMTMGSRPPARLTWYMENVLLTNYTERVSEDGNMTYSNLTFVPTLLDNNKTITCRAENPNITGSAVEDPLKLNVFYVPIPELKLGANMNARDIEEGDDVYFECKVNANPVAYKVVWKHNGNVLQHDANKGMIVQQQSLALRRVNRSQAGNYTCIASNVEGDGFSNSVELKIQYKPICIANQTRIYGVSSHEEARVVCRVEAYPMPSKFSWTFNNTGEQREVPDARFNTTQQAESILTYKPVSEMDYGTVLCWASNILGQSTSPCIFHIIAAATPEPPYNCTLTNQTTQSLSVECTAGFDGGQTQHFQLEVYDQLTNQLVANVSSNDSAAFSVHDLQPGRILRMAVYAYNSKGRSHSTLLEGFTLKVAEKQTGTPVPFEITPLLGILIGVVAALLLCTVTILLALKVRSDRRAQRPGDLPLKKATAPSSEDLYDADDRNPDVVPTNKDSDYQLTGSTAGTPLAVQGTPDGLSITSLAPSQQAKLLPNYSHDCNNYPTLPLNDEVTYAQLCLARPSTLTTSSGTETKLASIGGLSSLAGFGSVNGGGNGSGGGVIVGGKPNYAKEATVYACIDHNARPTKQIDQLSPTPGAPATTATTCLPPVNILQDSMGLKQHHQQQPLQQHPREVVTVRTPLISSQESCV